MPYISCDCFALPFWAKLGAGMYVCICNALTDGEIAETSRRGARTVKEAYAVLGVESNCGHCTCTAEEILRQADPACVPQAAE